VLLAVELLRNTDTRRLERARNTYVVTFTVAADRDDVARPIAQIVATTTCPPPHGSGRTHRVEARLYAPSGQRMPSWVTCSCEDIMYRWEAVLTRQNSSSLLHSNGAWPVVTNPSGRKAICKHVARVLSRAIKDSKVVAAIRGLPQSEVLHSRYPRPELQGARKLK
jgi:hypothetical protein